MNRLIKLLVLALAFLPLFPLTAGVAASTTDQKLFSACDPKVTNSQAAKSPICSDQNTTTNPVNQKIKTAADIVALVTGAVAVVMIVVSGFTFITAGGSVTGQRSGDPNRLKSARATLSAAIIGLVIIALAWTIISFVTDRIIK